VVASQIKPDGAFLNLLITQIYFIAVVVESHMRNELFYIIFTVIIEKNNMRI